MGHPALYWPASPEEVAQKSLRHSDAFFTVHLPNTSTSGWCRRFKLEIKRCLRLRNGWNPMRSSVMQQIIKQIKNMVRY